MRIGTKALGSPTPGRPVWVADIPFENDKTLPILSGFYRIVKQLNYRELMALARAFNMAERTVYAWRYGERFPRHEIMEMVIDWAKQGKPMRKEYQKPLYYSML